MTNTAFQPKPGDFVSETLVTDTRTYEVVATTAKTIKVRTTGRTNNVLKTENVGGNPYPCTWFEVVSDPTGTVFTLRLRKDGTYRFAANSGKFRPATLVDGKPASFVDYRF
jgi:hypothetical protein